MSRIGISKEQRKTITSLKRSILGESEPVLRKKKKVAKGANPLSRRRRRDREAGPAEGEEEGEGERRSRRRRRRVKLAAHVKEELARRRQTDGQTV